MLLPSDVTTARFFITARSTTSIEYINQAAIADDGVSPLFRSVGRSRNLTDRRLDRVNAWRVMKKRAKEAGVYEKISPHSLRATGITIYLGNGGSLEHEQTIAAMLIRVRRSFMTGQAIRSLLMRSRKW